jgi:small subunit ribosomal protein S1
VNQCLDINELKSMGLGEKIKVGETIPVLLERIEDKNGEDSCFC